MSTQVQAPATMLDPCIEKQGFRSPGTWLGVRSSAWLAKLPGLLALTDQAIVSLTNFGIGIAIGRICGRAELGTYSVSLTLIAAADTLSSSLVSTPYMVRNPRLAPEAQRNLLGTVLVHHLTLTSLVAGLLALGVALLGKSVAPLGVGASQALIAAALALLFVNTREFLRRVSFARLEPNVALALDAVSCGLQAAGMAILCMAHRLNVTNVFLLAGGSAAFVSAAWLVARRQSFRLDPADWLPEVRRTWSFAKWLCLSAVLWNSGSYLYPWLLTTFHGAAAAGTWAACSTIASLGNPVMLGLGNHVAPKIAHVRAAAGIAAMRGYVRRSSLLFVGLLLPFVLVFGIWGSQIVTRVYGSGYKDTASVLLFLSLTVLVSAFSFSYSRGLYCLGRAKADSLINLAALACALSVGVVAVHLHSVVGAALASLVSVTVTGVIRVLIVNQQAQTVETP